MNAGGCRKGRVPRPLIVSSTGLIRPPERKKITLLPRGDLISSLLRSTAKDLGCESSLWTSRSGGRVSRRNVPTHTSAVWRPTIVRRAIGVERKGGQAEFPSEQRAGVGRYRM